MSMGMTVVMLVMAMPVMVVMVMIMIMMLVSMIVVAVTAMGMVVMRVALMAVGMMGMDIMGMDIMGVAVRGSLGIGAAFGIERRFDLDQAGAEPLDHRLDDMIAPDAQRLGHDLGRQMAIAEMPGDADQMMRIAALDLDQRLGGGDHLDQPAVLKHQRIAAAQRCGIFEVEQEGQSARTGHRHAPTMTIVEIEHDRVGRRFRPPMLRLDLRRADHVSLFLLSSLPGGP